MAALSAQARGMSMQNPVDTDRPSIVSIDHKLTHDVSLTPPTERQLEEALSICKNLKLEGVLPALQERFVQVDKFARIITRALRTGKNALIWGPGGHAKSMLTRETLDLLNLRKASFILDFGEGMDEAALWGGYNFQKLKRDDVLDYQSDRSFIKYPIVIFEELLDAPAPVVYSLKNTLSSGTLSKGATPHQVRTHSIIALTNKDPKEFAAASESAHALFERFPLQLDLRWSDYSANSYRELFTKLNRTDDVPLMTVLSELLAQRDKDTRPISPRTAVHALEVVLNAQCESGDGLTRGEHLSDLEFIPEIGALGEKNLMKAASQLNALQIEDVISSAEKATMLVKESIKDRISNKKKKDLLQHLATIDAEFTKIDCPSALNKRFNSARKGLSELMLNLVQEKA